MRSLALALILSISNAFAFPQLINYQGSLADPSGAPLDTTVAMTFTMYTNAVGGAQLWTEIHPSVTCASGLFSVQLGEISSLTDVIFNQSQVWLGVAVGNNSEMSPRTHVSSVAYSYYTGTVHGATGGTITGDVNVIGKGNFGTGNTNTGVNAFVVGTNNTAGGYRSTICGGSENSTSHFYCVVGGGTNNRASGEYSVIAGGGGPGPDDSNSAYGNWSVIGGGFANQANHVATVDGGQGNRATGEYSKVGGGFYCEAAGDFSTICNGRYNLASHDYATIGGGELNWADSTGVTIGGGSNNTASGRYAVVSGGGFNIASGAFSVIAGGGESFAWGTNEATGNHSTISGGLSNLASEDGATVSGGQNNTASGLFSKVGGGFFCEASGQYSAVVAGSGNTASGNYSSVGGGDDCEASSSYSTVGGGNNNAVSGTNSCIPGGANNSCSGDYSFVCGNNADLTGDSTFLFSDGTYNGSVGSGGPRRFVVIASGGSTLFSSSDVSTGVFLPAGGGSWSSVSDSTKKRNRRNVDTHAILEKVMNTPIQQWSYKSQNESIEHIGPMAQDFWREFHVGDDLLTISTIDPSGIALAAIQELTKQNQELRNEVNELRELVELQMKFGMNK